MTLKSQEGLPYPSLPTFRQLHDREIHLFKPPLSSYYYLHLNLQSTTSACFLYSGNISQVQQIKYTRIYDNDLAFGEKI